MMKLRLKNGKRDKIAGVLQCKGKERKSLVAMEVKIEKIESFEC